MDFDRRSFAFFWSKVRIGQPHECWPYTAGLDPDGYGIFHCRGKSVRAHRLAFFYGTGYEAKPMALHHCHNRACCNPTHLYAGTALDNMSDCIDAGNFVTVYVDGERHRNAKMTDAQVADALHKISLGQSQASVARELGVSPTAIAYHRKKKVSL